MKIINYIKNKGIKRAFQVLWQYKIEIVLEKVMLFFTKNKPLQDKIVIESHNDFDCNGGAFYDYLIKNKYNEKYKIVWLVRKRVKEKLPKNVTYVYLKRPSIIKAYHIVTYKFMTFDCEFANKYRNDQIVVYCNHGSMSLKNVIGKLFIPKETNYFLVPSKKYTPYLLNQFSLKKDDKRPISIGFPNHDSLLSNDNMELRKITDDNYDKVIIWMPTFRKLAGEKRIDGNMNEEIGVPLFNSLKEVESLNEFLKERKLLLIIKIHPKQDIKKLSLQDFTNIKILTGTITKELNIDIYKLLGNVDALISDYSSVTFDFLQVNKPIGYVFGDIKDYKLGMMDNDIEKYTAGKIINSVSDLYDFIIDVKDNKDIYYDKRLKLRNDIYEFHDTNSSERLAKLLKL